MGRRRIIQVALLALLFALALVSTVGAYTGQVISISTTTVETHTVRIGHKTTTIVDTDVWSTSYTDTDGQPPASGIAAPANLRVTETTSTTLRLDFDPVPGATSYTLYLDGAVDGTGTGCEGACTFWTFGINTPLQPNTSYVLGVEASDGTSTSARATLTASTSGVAPPPPAACADGLDNDGDGLIDFPADPGCVDSADTDEFNLAPPPSGDVANVWIDTNGGSCTRSATPVAYSDAAACGPSWNAALLVMQAGDLGRIVAGVYPHQRLTAGKVSLTKLIGASKASVIVRGNDDCRPEFGMFAVLCSEAANVQVENVTIDSQGVANYASGSRILANGVKYVNVDLYGDYPALAITGVSGFAWVGGSHGQDGRVPPPYTCSFLAGQPVIVGDSSSTLIEGVRFNPKFTQAGAGPYCGADNNPHLENIRLESASNLTVRNNRFVAGGDFGSGHIFTATGAPGFVLDGNIFEPVNGSYAMQMYNGSSTGWLIRNNRFDQGVIIPPGTPIACGNTGQVPASWTAPCP